MSQAESEMRVSEVDRDKMPLWVEKLLWWFGALVLIVLALVAYSNAQRTSKQKAKEYVECLRRNGYSDTYCD